MQVLHSDEYRMAHLYDSTICSAKKTTKHVDQTISAHMFQTLYAA